jgi:hypothetical protein
MRAIITQMDILKSIIRINYAGLKFGVNGAGEGKGRIDSTRPRTMCTEDVQGFRM